MEREEDEHLKTIANSRSLPYGLINRARIVLMAGEGTLNRNIAQKVRLSSQMVCKWRQRYVQQGLRMSVKPFKPNLKIRTHWTIRSVARETQLSRPTVHRIWQAFGLQPHRQGLFKLSTDPFFFEKVWNIVGSYLNPPEKAMALCVDERSQALDIATGLVLTCCKNRHGHREYLQSIIVMDKHLLNFR